MGFGGGWWTPAGMFGAGRPSADTVARPETPQGPRAAAGDLIVSERAGLPVPAVRSPWSPDTLESIVFGDLFGDDVNWPPTRANAMRVPAIAKGRHVVAPQVADSPLRAMQGAERLPDEEQPTWIYRTDDGVSPWHRMLWTADDLIFYGWSLWFANRGADRQLLTASRCSADRWSFNSDYGLEIDGRPYQGPDNGVILIPGPHEGILTFGTTAIRHAQRLMDAAERASRNPNPNVDLHQTGGEQLTDPEIDTLISTWADARSGKNQGVAYTNQWIEAKPGNAIDAQLLIEGRNAAAVECARIIGIMAAMVDATVPKSSLNYETQSGRGLEHIEYGVSPYMRAIAERLSLDDVMPRGKRVAFDLTEQVETPVNPTGPSEQD
jgi:hypothetical protein